MSSHRSSTIGPTRIVLNFAHQCNMSCEWCYVPFKGQRPDPLTRKRIIERSAEIGFKVLTLGGGDPLLYPFLPHLIESAQRCGLFVHIDTNGIGLCCTDNTVSSLLRPIGLLGLPLDGPRAEIHDRMRSAISHFQLVIDRLAWLAPFMQKVKINTLVSDMNADSIAEMIPLVRGYGPSRWSLYQYWPLSLGRSASAVHFVSNERFAQVMGKIPPIVGRTQVEANPVPVRRRTYPFVSHEGIVYLHHQEDVSAYEEMGSIFDDEVVAALFAKCGGERQDTSSRYS